jgi:hypothetical protein
LTVFYEVVFCFDEGSLSSEIQCANWSFSVRNIPFCSQVSEVNYFPLLGTRTTKVTSEQYFSIFLIYEKYIESFFQASAFQLLLKSASYVDPRSEKQRSEGNTLIRRLEKRERHRS